MEPQERQLRTTPDTDLHKLVAIAAMLLDHIGGAFFPETPIVRWIGRLAFPLFCYCMTVGLLYTHDIRRYLGRLAIFAVVSQPFWILAFNADDILGNLTNWNIFFTLFLSLLAMWGLTTRRWWIFVLGEQTRPAGGAVYPVLASRPVGRLPGGSPGPGGGRPRRQLDDLRPAGPAADPLPHPLRHPDSQVVLLRLLSRPLGNHRPGGVVYGRVIWKRSVLA